MGLSLGGIEVPHGHMAIHHIEVAADPVRNSTPAFERFLSLPSQGGFDPSAFAASLPSGSGSQGAGAQGTAAPQATSANPVLVSNILGNLFVQQLQEGAIGTGGTQSLGPAAGPSGAVGAGGTNNQVPNSLNNLIFGLQMGMSSPVAPSFNAPSTTAAPPSFVPPPLVQPPLLQSFSLPTGGGGGLTGEGEAQGDGTPAGEGQTPQNQPDGGETQPTGLWDHNPEVMGPGVLEALSLSPGLWTSQQEMASNGDRSVQGFAPGDETGSLLETEGSQGEDSKIDLAGLLAAISLACFPSADKRPDFLKEDRDMLARKRHA